MRFNKTQCVYSMPSIYLSRHQLFYYQRRLNKCRGFLLLQPTRIWWTHSIICKHAGCKDLLPRPNTFHPVTRLPYRYTRAMHTGSCLSLSSVVLGYPNYNSKYFYGVRASGKRFCELFTIKYNYVIPLMLKLLFWSRCSKTTNIFWVPVLR